MGNLVLTRRPGEAICITPIAGQTITVEVDEIAGNRVRLRIVAESEVKIARRELLEEKSESE